MTTKLEPKGKLGVAAAAVGAVNGPEDELFDWDAVDWRACERQVERLRQRIALLHMEGEPIFKDAASVDYRNRPVVQRLSIQEATGNAKRHVPQRAGSEADRVFKIAALHLEMVRAEIHSFRPDDSGQIFHRVSQAGIGLYFTIAALPYRRVDVAA